VTTTAPSGTTRSGAAAGAGAAAPELALSTAPLEEPTPDPRSTRRRPGPLAGLRRSWRQLTSMRTALLLLFLLALAAVPGSLLPQRSLNPLLVDDYLAAHPRLGPLLDRLSLFDVYASPWFAAIYLLLAVSLVGCLVPRLRLHARALRTPPPAAPRHLDRLPHATSYEVDDSTSAAEAVERARTLLRRRRFRVVTRAEPGGVSLAAEKGYLRETGNLVFHLSLLGLLGGLAAGALWGYEGTVIVAEKGEFCASVQQFDNYTPGRLVDDADLPPLCVRLDDFAATYYPNGAPQQFDARLTYTDGLDAEPRRYTLQVNEPLRLDGGRAYLLGHGYAPRLTVTDPSGQVFAGVRAPFLPQDTNGTGEGVLKLPGAAPRQLAFEGIFVPTVPEGGPVVASAFPAALNPGLTLVAYSGDLGVDSGRPQSVYSLDDAQIEKGELDRGEAKLLRPGESWTLADGTVVRFDGFDQWASLRVAADPGETLSLVSAVLIVVGLLLSLRVRRRRVWVRALDENGAEGGRRIVTVGGLARTDSDSFAEEFADLARQLSAGVPTAAERK